MSSPTMDELTSSENFTLYSKKNTLQCDYFSPRKNASSPTIEELYPIERSRDSSEQTPYPSPRHDRTRPRRRKLPGMDGEQSEPQRNRPCRKAKTEALDKSFAQTYRSPLKAKRRRSQSLDVCTITRDSDKVVEALQNTLKHAKSLPEDVRKIRLKRNSKPGVRKLSNKHRMKLDFEDNSQSQEKNAAIDYDDSKRKSLENPRNKNGIELVGSDCSNNVEDTVITSTPNESKPKKKRVWDTSWLDDEPVSSLSEVNLGSDKASKDLEDDAFSSCLSGSQRTYSDLSSDEDSDDDDLPDMLGSSVTNAPVEKGDLIWLKYGSYPFWPSIVRVVYKSKKQVKKITVAFVGDIDASMGHQHIRVSYKRKNIFPFASCGHDQHAALKQDGMKSPYHEQFRSACDQAEVFLYRKAKDESIDIFQYFSHLFKSVNVHVTTGTSTVCEAMASEDETKYPVLPTSTESSPISSPQLEENSMFTRATQQRIQNRAIKNQKLVDYIKQDECKNHLSNIFHGQYSSERHKLFFKTKKSKAEKNELKLGGYGPIADQNQQEDILGIVWDYIKEWKKNGEELQLADYNMSVLTPEAIIFAMQKVLRQSRKKAEEMFYRGAKYYKEEKKEMERQFNRQFSPVKNSQSSDSDSDC